MTRSPGRSVARGPTSEGHTGALAARGDVIDQISKWRSAHLQSSVAPSTADAGIGGASRQFGQPAKFIRGAASVVPSFHLTQCRQGLEHPPTRVLTKPKGINT